MKNQKSVETLQKRKFLMVLPLLIFPFMTMAFWALGGGKGSSNPVNQEPQRGFNTSLPQAKFNSEEKQDKFSVYETSAKSSQESNAISDQVYNQLALTESPEFLSDPNEEKINEKLALINSELRNSRTSGNSYHTTKRSNYGQATSMGADVGRLENLMQSLQTGNENDPEMAQLNAVLEKILEIQHPGRAREKMKSKNTTSEAYKVHIAKDDASSSLYTLAKNINSKYAGSSQNAIKATIHQDQDIVSGSVVKLRLLDSINVNGILIPKNAFIYGIASVDEERLKIEIATLRYKNSILPVSLTAYDLDGLEGLYIPGAIARDASKKGVDDAIQSLQIMTMDPSVSSQVAGAGIQAAKGLFSRKVKQVRVKVKAGYQLLLRDNNQKTK